MKLVFITVPPGNKRHGEVCCILEHNGNKICFVKMRIA